MAKRTAAERMAVAQRESRDLDFKERFGPDQASECVELVKDILTLRERAGQSASRRLPRAAESKIAILLPHFRALVEYC